MPLQPAAHEAAGRNRNSRHSIVLQDVRWSYVDPEWISADFLSQQVISGRLIKQSAKRCVICSDDDIFVKEIRYSGRRSLLKTLAGGTACKEGKINLELARREVNVPQVIAYGAATRGGLLQRDLLLTRKVDAAVPLLDYLADRHKSQPRSSKLALIEAFARFVRRLHDRGIRHNDLHVGNILVRENGKRLFFFVGCGSDSGS